MSANALFACYGGFSADAADFDGTNDYMTRGADLTGFTDAQNGLLSLWVRLDGGDGQEMCILSNSTSGFGFRVIRSSSNKIQVLGENSVGTEVLKLESTTSYVSGASWIHVVASWYLQGATGELYINGANDLNGATKITTSSQTIDYTKGNFSVGSYVGGGSKLDGCLAELWMSNAFGFDGTSDASSLLGRFRSNDGKPIYRGVDGAIVGSIPQLFLSLYNGETASNFATNRGSGGNFSITGTLATASSSPSD